MTHKDIAACILAGCKQAEHCVKADEINKRYAWKPAEPMRQGGQVFGKDPLVCTASMTPELKRYNGARIEIEEEPGWKQRFWVRETQWWRPIHVLDKLKTSTFGDPASIYFPRDPMTWRTVSTRRR